MILRQKFSFMFMQKSQQEIIELQNEKNTNILQVEGYNLMYHKLMLLSMRWMKKIERVQKSQEKMKN